MDPMSRHIYEQTAGRQDMPLLSCFVTVYMNCLLFQIGLSLFEGTPFLADLKGNQQDPNHFGVTPKKGTPPYVPHLSYDARTT